MEPILDENLAILNQLKQLRIARSKEFVPVSDKYLEQAEEEMNKRIASEILFQQVVYYHNVTGEYEWSNNLAVTCLHYADITNNITLRANALRMMGVNHTCLGDVLQARKVYDEGIKILEGKGQLSKEDKEILAGIYFNIVTLYKELDIDESRLQFIDKAFKLFSEIENKQGIARCYIAYANNFPDIKNTDLALEYYKLAADIFSKIYDQRGLGNCQIGIGYRLGLQGKFEEAMKMLNEGIENLRQSSNSYVMMQGYFNLAIVLRLQQKYDEAIGYFKEIEDTVARYKVKMNMMFIYEEWAKALEEKGNYKEALEYQKKFYVEREKAHEFDKATAEPGYKAQKQTI